MSKLIATIHLLGLDVVDGVRRRLAPDERERGSVSIEQVVITAALLLAAIALVAIISNAIGDRAQEIS
ncbi:hypothetical protein ATJ88_2485 [Isoptericola jiangsuensis]|uniref:Uncharacterized protein n=1 Tax=Isoptericola jiangsuensis TaxID=548579 RepID=A0A2A9EXA5_9MICO|nr:hypothetical protein [Isoptericola jiangsuensis]PFG43777.1 hypothetical protein ATJ88_2485 [Isoptericola jiangsuensis]